MSHHIGNAVWLICALPVSYFRAVTHCLRGAVSTSTPFIATLALSAGAVTGIIQRRRTLFLFLFPFVVSELFVAIAGWLRGQLRGNASLLPFYVFTVVQVALTAYLLYRVRGARFATLALTVFSASYAFWALFAGGMAFADDWL